MKIVLSFNFGEQGPFCLTKEAVISSFLTFDRQKFIIHILNKTARQEPNYPLQSWLSVPSPGVGEHLTIKI